MKYERTTAASRKALQKIRWIWRSTQPGHIKGEGRTYRRPKVRVP